MTRCSKTALAAALISLWVATPPQAFDPAQLDVLLDGVERWNAWRAANPETPVDLTEAPLDGMSLDEADLRGADLGGANLAGASLAYAVLIDANLGGADVTGADFFGARLEGARLKDLRGATPSVRCASDSCVVQAGLSLGLRGESTITGGRYHQWSWRNARHRRQFQNIDTVHSAFLSQPTFNAVAFPSRRATRTITLRACDAGFGRGACRSASVTVVVRPAPRPVVRCGDDDTCEVRAGASLRVSADSRNSQLRYHRYAWRSGAGRIRGATVDAGAELTSAMDVSARPFRAGARVQVWITACSAGFGSGACVTTTRRIRVTAMPAPTIDCAGGVCTVQRGLHLRLFGDSSASEARYHQWSWRGARGRAEVRNYDTARSAFASRASVDASTLYNRRTVRTVVLEACDTGFGRGNCGRQSVRINITPAPSPVLRCRGDDTCEVRAAASQNVAGDSRNSSFRYHTYRWRNGGHRPQTVNIDAGRGLTSSTNISTSGFRPRARVPVSLTACSTGFGAGTCVRSVRTLQLTPVPPPTLTCEGGPCEVQAGRSLALMGDTTSTGARFHRWIWRGATRRPLSNDVDTAGSNSSRITFSALDFPSRRTTRTVTLEACFRGFGRGDCRRASVIIVVGPAPPPSLRCLDSAACEVRANSTLGLSGESHRSHLRYHTYGWRDVSGRYRRINIDSGARLTSATTFNPNGFRPGARVRVGLTACATGFGAGTCVPTHRVVTVVAPPRPTIGCDDDPCTVQAGRTLTLRGRDGARGRYHQWTWFDGVLRSRVHRVEVRGPSFSSEVIFDARRFRNGRAQRRVTLETCTRGFSRGFCHSTRLRVTILPAPPPDLQCRDVDGCRVVTGTFMTLAADSNNSGLRYHTYRWPRRFGRGVRQPSIDTGADLVSTARLSAAGRRAGERVRVEVTACARRFGSGTCASTVRTITVVAPPPPAITCPAGSCRVYAGHSFILDGESSRSGAAYHRWTWRDASGRDQRFSYRTPAPTFASRTRFDAAGFPGAEGGSRTVTLEACTDGFDRGDCRRASVEIVILALAPPDLRCLPAGSCEVEVGGTQRLVGNSRRPGLRYHTYQWGDAAGRERTIQIEAGVELTSEVVVDAAGFPAGASVRVTLTACGSGFGVGTCMSTSQTLTITDPAGPTINCGPEDCVARLGEGVELTGDASASRLGYHQWRFFDLMGAEQSAQFDTSNAGFISTFFLPTIGFHTLLEPADIDLELEACEVGFGSGLCQRALVTVRVEPAPLITCEASDCAFPAGFDIGLMGTASALARRFHTWSWEDANGQQVSQAIDAPEFVSSIEIGRHDFQPDEPLIVLLETCQDGFGEGACEEATRRLTVGPPRDFVAFD